MLGLMTEPQRGLLTEEERVTIRHHTGYLNVGEVSTFALGVPAAVETQFIIEGAMDRVLPAALTRLRNILSILDGIEGQKVGDLELAAVNKLDTIEINQAEQKQLDKQYDYWVNALCNILGVSRNPFDARKYNAGGGINAGVQG